MAVKTVKTEREREREREREVIVHPLITKPWLLLTVKTKLQLTPYYNSRLKAIFLDSLGKLVPECLHSGFHWS